MPICVLFLIWPRDPLYYQISLFLSIFLDFWSSFEGATHALKMFTNPFLLKIYPKASKKLKFTSICSDDHGDLSPPPTTVHCSFSLKLIILIIILIKIVQDSHGPVHNASFGTFKVKIGRVYSPESMFEFPWKCDFSQFWSKLVKMSISQENFRTDSGMNSWPILALKVPKEASWTGQRHLLTVCI